MLEVREKRGGGGRRRRGGAAEADDVGGGKNEVNQRGKRKTPKPCPLERSSRARPALTLIDARRCPPLIGRPCPRPRWASPPAETPRSPVPRHQTRSKSSPNFSQRAFFCFSSFFTFFVFIFFFFHRHFYYHLFCFTLFSHLR